jgi:hypothetical protein
MGGEGVPTVIGTLELEHRAGGRPERSGVGGGNANENGGGRLGALPPVIGRHRRINSHPYPRGLYDPYRACYIEMFGTHERRGQCGARALTVLWRGVEQSGSSLGS